MSAHSLNNHHAGEYIAAEKLEVDFGTCNLVEQIWVYGNSYEVSQLL